MHLKSDIQKRKLGYKGGHLPYSGALLERAREMRKNPTEAELKMWNSYLRNHQLKFIRQKVIDHFIVDFYCPSKQLAIEIDGTIHEKQKMYDKKRSDTLTTYGVSIIRVENDDVLHNIGTVVKKIEECLNCHRQLA